MSKVFTHVEISPEQFDNMSKIEQLISFKQQLAQRRDQAVQQFQEELEKINAQAEGLSIDTSVLEENIQSVKAAYDNIIELAQKEFASRVKIDQSAGN